MDTDYELSIRATIRNLGTSLFPNYELHITYTVARDGLLTSVESVTDGYGSFHEARREADIMTSLIETSNETIREHVRSGTINDGRNLGS